MVSTFPDGKSTIILVAAKLKYDTEGERGSRRYLDATLLDEQPYRMAGLWNCRKVRKNPDGTTKCEAEKVRADIRMPNVRRADMPSSSAVAG